MVALVFCYASSAEAAALIAGVPAAARTAWAWQKAHHDVSPASVPPLQLMLADGGMLNDQTLSEINRLAPRIKVACGIPGDKQVRHIVGEAAYEPEILRSWLEGSEPVPTFTGPLSGVQAQRVRENASRFIVKATAKPGDGIISRNINRPISQAVSLRLLRLCWVRPGHATALTAIIAATMMACLVVGGGSGLIAGAILFQLASIIDGVDGEIARATSRASARGAALDSITDAFTNVGFIIGVTLNSWEAGALDDAMLGLAALALLSTGLIILGLHAHLRGEPLNFDAAKSSKEFQRGPIANAMRYLTMRDFYCLFLAVMVVAGFLTIALAAFAMAATGWLIAIILILLRQRKIAA